MEGLAISTDEVSEEEASEIYDVCEEVHIMPVHDTREHMHTEPCWCDPRRQAVDDKHTLVIHNALDSTMSKPPTGRILH